MGEEESIYDLGLNEGMPLNYDVRILRVPGGWIYTHFNIKYSREDEDEIATSVFVPYNDEFKED